MQPQVKLILKPWKKHSLIRSLMGCGLSGVCEATLCFGAVAAGPQRLHISFQALQFWPFAILQLHQQTIIAVHCAKHDEWVACPHL